MQTEKEISPIKFKLVNRVTGEELKSDEEFAKYFFNVGESDYFECALTLNGRLVVIWNKYADNENGKRKQILCPADVKTINNENWRVEVLE